MRAAVPLRQLGRYGDAEDVVPVGLVVRLFDYASYLVGLIGSSEQHTKQYILLLIEKCFQPPNSKEKKKKGRFTGERKNAEEQ